MYATSFTTTANFERSASSVACYNHQKVTSLRISKLSPVTACTKRPFTHRYLRLGTWLCVCVGVCWITQVLQHFLPNGQIKKYVKQTFARHFKAKTRAHILNGKHLGAHTSTQTHTYAFTCYRFTPQMQRCQQHHHPHQQQQLLQWRTQTKTSKVSLPFAAPLSLPCCCFVKGLCGVHK